MSRQRDRTSDARPLFDLEERRAIKQTLALMGMGAVTVVLLAAVMSLALWLVLR